MRWGRFGWGLVTVAAMRVVDPLQAAGARDGHAVVDIQLPSPVTDAIVLLGWSGADVPPIVVVDRKSGGGMTRVNVSFAFDVRAFTASICTPAPLYSSPCDSTNP